MVQEFIVNPPIQVNIPIIQAFKTAWITNIIHHAIVICDETKVQGELNKIKKLIAWNGFPKWIGRTLIAKKLKNINTANNKNQLTNKNNENVRASKMRNFGTHFFVQLITCLRARSCTSHFVHLKQLFMHVFMLTCTSPCTYYKGKRKAYSTHHQPRTQSGYLYFILQKKK